MNGAAAVRVVVFNAMRSGSVGERRIDRQGANRRANDASATSRRRSGDRALHHPLHASRGYFARSTDGDSQIVQEKILRPIENLTGQRLRPKAVEELDQFAGILRL